MLDRKQTLDLAPSQSGVYIMYGKNPRNITTEKIIYIGKSKNIKKRLSSYFNKNLSIKTAKLMHEVMRIETIVTVGESESLILEDSLIKKHQPRFNILLRDDKSYPYIWFSGSQFQRIMHNQRKMHKTGEYFGPYTSKNITRNTIDLLEKTFLLRTCGDIVFKQHKHKPCLKYQIKHCSAPCANLISKENYAQSVKYAKKFLNNSNFDIIDIFAKQMQEYAKKEEFEKATEIRNKISQIRSIQNQQTVPKEAYATNVWGVSICLQSNRLFSYLLDIRDTKVQNTLNFFSELGDETNTEFLLEEIIKRYYFSLPVQQLPSIILLPKSIKNNKSIELVLNKKTLQNKIKIICNPRKEIYKQWLNMAEENAINQLEKNKKSKTYDLEMKTLSAELGIKKIETIECFDVSHFSGEHTVAGCTYFDINGLNKRNYLKFNIKTAKQSDDYAATYEAVLRRMAYVKTSVSKKIKTNDAHKNLPDVLLIDGGKGQIKSAILALKKQKIHSQNIIGIAKGVTRKYENEEYFFCNFELGKENKIKEITLSKSSASILQITRDAVHNFAINSSRGQLIKTRTTSKIATLEGIGSKKQRDLLVYFGSVEGVKNATETELMKTPGIGRKIAQSIIKQMKNI